MSVTASQISCLQLSGILALNYVHFFIYSPGIVACVFIFLKDKGNVYQ